MKEEQEEGEEEEKKINNDFDVILFTPLRAALRAHVETNSMDNCVYSSIRTERSRD